MMMSSSSSSTLSSTTWHQGCRSPLTYQASSMPSFDTLSHQPAPKPILLGYFCHSPLWADGVFWNWHCRSCREEGAQCPWSSQILCALPSLVHLNTGDSVDLLKLCKLLRAKATDRVRLEQDIRHAITASLQHVVKNELMKFFRPGSFPHFGSTRLCCHLFSLSSPLCINT